MRYYRLIGLFEGNRAMPLVVVAKIDPALDGMVGIALDWTPLDHFDSAADMKEKQSVVIQHYTTTALAIFTWAQLVAAYRIALSVTFGKFGPQLKKEKNGNNAVSIEEWRNGAWATLGPWDMPVLHHAPPHQKEELLYGDVPSSMNLAAAALRDRPRSSKKA